MRSVLHQVVVIAAAATSVCQARAEPIGRWVANVPPKPYCSPSRLTLDVRPGSLTIRIGQVAGVIRFDRDHFTADDPNLWCGLRHAVGFRTGGAEQTRRWSSGGLY